MTPPIQVSGGTGTLGQHVTSRLRDVSRHVQVLSRHGGDDVQDVEFVPGDLTTGNGVDAAVKGTDVVVHLAGSANRLVNNSLIAAALLAAVLRLPGVYATFFAISVAMQIAHLRRRS
jgi:nucleoside-diphosphate-sugar epimerase